MPCYRCDRRQSDPGRGASPWKRGVLAGTQVLVCPSCQQEHDWEAALDECAACGSTRLVRSLGDTRCLACGAAGEEAGGDPGDAAPGPPHQPAPGALAADVSTALRKVFGGTSP
ncbi:MAG TPA: hypothetical protein VNB94_04155 [Mycobacteriales bacterium]|nr:hypothetical protein [Mycobacteriales bacterium]